MNVSPLRHRTKCDCAETHVIWKFPNPLKSGATATDAEDYTYGTLDEETITQATVEKPDNHGVELALMPLCQNTTAGTGCTDVLEQMPTSDS